MAAGRPTSFDIAALAGVSQPTVSRALRGDKTVSAATRMRVETVARQLNYRVDRAASSLRRGQANTLALLFFQDAMPDGSGINPFFLSMLGSILTTAALRGYDLLTSFQQLSNDWHVDYEDSRKADGMILLGYGDYRLYRPRLEHLVRQKAHFVCWGAVEPGVPGTVIGCDNRGGGRQAGEHLIERGCQRIAFVGDVSNAYPEFRERYRGLADVLRANQLPLDPGLQVDTVSLEEGGYEATQRLIARGVPFDAVFAASDLIALGTLRALAGAGLDVPGDVRVVGFDDIPAAAFTRLPLSTVAQDYGRAGATLVDTLISQIGNEPTTGQLLPTRLVVRASS